MSLKVIYRSSSLQRSILCTKSYMSSQSASKFQFSSTHWNCNKSHTTVDSADVNHHASISKSWWDLNGPMKGLHAMNMLRVPFVRDGLVNTKGTERSPKPLQGLKILDVGCGGGILSEALSRLGANVTGVDASKELIELAKTHSCENTSILDNLPTYCHSTIEDHAKENENIYDGVVASEIIEHVADKELFMSACVKSLKPSGKIFITTPNRTRLTQILGIWFAENVLRSPPKGTHEFSKLCTPNEVASLLERNNCHVELSYGMMYNFISNKWFWTENQSLLFAVQAVKLN